MKEKFRLYYVDLKYIRDLHNVDDNVMSVSPQTGKEDRPFLGIVTIIESKKYCVPLTSGDKIKFKHKKNSIDFIKIPDENMKDEFGANITIGGINLNNMIPVNDTVIQPVDIAIHSSDNKKQRNNKKRLTKELDWCQRNQDLITRKARKLYDLRLNHSMENINLTRRCCDFKKLEAVLERRLAKTQSNEYEPKEKAVAASAEIPVRHPAIIRRRKNTGRSR